MASYSAFPRFSRCCIAEKTEDNEVELIDIISKVIPDIIEASIVVITSGVRQKFNMVSHYP